MMLRSYVIGSAHDEAALRALNDWLAAKDARLLDSSYTAEGGVETLRWKFKVGGQEVLVFADTEAGLSLCSSADYLLHAATAAIKQRTSLPSGACAAA